MKYLALLRFLFWPFIALVVFIPVIGSYNLLESPDSAPWYSLYERLYQFESLLTTPTSLAPHDILHLALPPLFFHDFSYWLDTVLISLGFYWFMRGRQVPIFPAMITSGLFAFAGYSFTLISAGHRSYFSMGPYAVFTFALLTHGILKNRKLFFALAGCTAAWTLRFGPDVCMFYLPTAALYALWLLFFDKSGGLPLRKKAPGFAVGAGIATLTFLLTVAPSAYHIATSGKAGREEQIASVTSSTKNTENGSPEEKLEAKQREDKQKWIFATNWSLPPEEALEFIAPCVYGASSVDRKSPYWGRLGRTDGWEEHKEGFFNFRQHTVHLGAVPIAMLLFAILYFVDARLKGRRRESKATAIGGGAETYVTDTPFWLCIGLVALLLSFGRYAPFYKFFYALPYASYLRAPVKFFRLVELATMVLAASGATLLVYSSARLRLVRIFAYISLLCAGLCAIRAFSISANPEKFAATLKAIGQLRLIDPMAKNALFAIGHAIFGFGIVGICALAISKRRLPARWCYGLLLAASSISVILVSRQFIQIIPKHSAKLSYEANFVTRSILSHEDYAPVLACHIPQQQDSGTDWFYRTLDFWRITRIPLPELDNEVFLRHSHGDVIRMWELCGARFVLVPATAAHGLDRKRTQHVAWLTLGQSSIVKTFAPDKKSLELLEVIAPVPYASLYTKWKSVAPENYMASVADIMRTGTKDVVTAMAKLPKPPKDAKAGKLEIIKERFRSGGISTVIKTSTDSEQLLVVNEPPSRALEAFIDNRPAEAFRAGYAGRGVIVPEGEHTVTFRRAKVNSTILISSTTMLALFVVGVAVALKSSWRGERNA